jgi:hypothetical protein
MGQTGAKMKDSFSWLGSKIGEGWGHVKAFGKKAWDKVKSVPVLGKIAEGIEKYTPIGIAAKNIISSVDTGVGATSRLLQGDIKGSIGTVTSGIRQQINQKNPLLEEIKKVPVLGHIAKAGEFAISKVPIYGGMSINDMRNIGNAALNSVDALKEGNIGGAVTEAAKAGSSFLSTKSGGLATAAKVVNTATSLAN